MSDEAWTQAVDPGSGKTYWANVVTGESQWEAPPGYGSTPRPSTEVEELMAALDEEEEEEEIDYNAVLEAEYEEPEEDDDVDLDEEDATFSSGDEAEDNEEEELWWELFDESYQIPYFYNVATQETRWERPETGRVVVPEVEDEDNKDVATADKGRDDATEGGRAQQDTQETHAEVPAVEADVDEAAATAAEEEEARQAVERAEKESQEAAAREQAEAEEAKARAEAEAVAVAEAVAAAEAAQAEAEAIARAEAEATARAEAEAAASAAAEAAAQAQAEAEAEAEAAERAEAEALARAEAEAALARAEAEAAAAVEAVTADQLAAEEAALADQVARELEAAMLEDQLKKASEQVDGEPDEEEAEPILAEGWEYAFDEATQQWYFFNRATNETTVEKEGIMLGGKLPPFPRPELVSRANTGDFEGPVLAEGWEYAFDEPTQQWYFFNRATNETTVDSEGILLSGRMPPLPAKTDEEDMVIIPGWATAFDEATQQWYYYNIETRETTVDPTGIVVPASSVTDKKDASESESAQAQETNASDEEDEEEIDETEVVLLPGWATAFDEATQQWYYYHIETRETRIDPSGITTRVPVERKTETGKESTAAPVQTSSDVPSLPSGVPAPLPSALPASIPPPVGLDASGSTIPAPFAIPPPIDTPVGAVLPAALPPLDAPVGTVIPTALPDLTYNDAARSLTIVAPPTDLPAVEKAPPSFSALPSLAPPMAIPARAPSAPVPGTALPSLDASGDEDEGEDDVETLPADGSSSTPVVPSMIAPPSSPPPASALPSSATSPSVSASKKELKKKKKKGGWRASGTFSSPKTKTRKRSATTSKLKEEVSTGHQRQESFSDNFGEFPIRTYAEKYFAKLKKGTSEKKLEAMTTFGTVKSPLTKSANDNCPKEALKVFKLIQCYMGDAKSKVDRPHLAQAIIEKGVNFSDLRDEIFCQLCKQTTNNPTESSRTLGWELFGIIVNHFPPSRDLEDPLRAHVQRCASMDGTVAIVATYIGKKLKAICKSGPRGRVPNLPEIERNKNAPFSTTLFGVTLEEVMELTKEKFPNLRVPAIVKVLAEAVVRLGGFTTEGIFRVPGDTEQVFALRVQLDNGNYEIGSDIQDPNTPASLLKLWMRELAEPMIPTEFYEECIACGEDATKALSVLERLPEINRLTAIYVVQFLQRCGSEENQKLNKMSISNLAMVFGPNFLRCPSEDPAVIFQNTKYEQIWLSLLIKNLDPTPLVLES